MSDQEWSPAWDDTVAAPALEGRLLQYVKRSTPWGGYWVAVIECRAEVANRVIEVWLDSALERLFALAKVKPGEHISLEVAERKDWGCPHDRYVLGVRRGGVVRWAEAVDIEARWVISPTHDSKSNARPGATTGMPESQK
jgi:hypothetical protein